MLIFISNEPRAYAWGSKDALAGILQTTPSGQPEAELWLGDHAGDPAAVDNYSEKLLTLIDLIKTDPKAYGYEGGSLPFLLKILGIGGPLSLQVHPNLSQAKEGFLKENAAGIPINDPKRSFKDQNHKPELLVALTSVRALKGFRPVSELVDELSAIVSFAGTCSATGAQAFYSLIVKLKTVDEVSGREAMLDWIFSGGKTVQDALSALRRIFLESTAGTNQVSGVPGIKAERAHLIRELLEQYPEDPGVLLALMTNLVQLDPGEAIFVPAGEIHAYLSGVGIEVMASSDNVLRAGLTQKNVDVAKLREILTLETGSGEPFAPTHERQGLTSWKPEVSDFVLYRLRVAQTAAPFESAAFDSAPFDDRSFNKKCDDAAEILTLTMPNPAVLVATKGQVLVERIDTHTESKTSVEVARVRQGRSLYISAGDKIEVSGLGEAFLATVLK